MNSSARRVPPPSMTNGGPEPLSMTPEQIVAYYVRLTQAREGSKQEKDPSTDLAHAAAPLTER